MTILTKFKVNDALLHDRKALHELVDIFWKYGTMTRDEVYKEISSILNTDIVPHISDMNLDDITKVASAFHNKLVALGYTPCSSCAYRDGNTSLGIPYCSQIGGHFCSMFCKEEDILHKCQHYKTMRQSDYQSQQ